MSRGRKAKKVATIDLDHPDTEILVTITARFKGSASDAAEEAVRLASEELTNYGEVLDISRAASGPIIGGNK